MSNFRVGDRVVVVGAHNTYRGQRGTVVGVDVDFWPYKVKLPDRIQEEPVPYFEEELELEGVYDALSSKPAEPESSSDNKVYNSVENGYTEGVEGDVVNHPSHYADGWSNGAEVIDITEHLNFNRGNAVKYLSRAGKKGGPEKELEDLRKALWYVNREVERLGGSVE